MAAAAPKYVPPGVQQLKSCDHLLVHQKTTFFGGNKYVVSTPDGREIFHVKEELGLITPMFDRRRRPFHISIRDSQQNQIILLRRPYTFGPTKMEVRLCGGLASVVRQEQTFVKPVLSINTAADVPVLRVKGQFVTSGMCDFEILTLEKQRIGVISKRWGGMFRELFTRSDVFVIQFPKHLNVCYKAALLGCCFLIDFLYYER